MHLGLSPTRYQLEIPQQVWAEFFEQFTDDHQGRPITLQISNRQLGRLNLLDETPLHSVIYTPPDDGDTLIIAVSRQLEDRELTYAHDIAYPQTITIVTDDDGLILSCTITDGDQGQTMIAFAW